MSDLFDTDVDDEELSLGEDEEIVVDFSEAVEFKILEPGWYHVVVENMERGETGERSKVPGTPQIKMRFAVQEEHEEYAGQKLFANWTLRGRGTGFTKSGLKAIFGEAPPSGGSFCMSDVLGAHLEVFCRPKITSVEDGGTGEPQNTITTYRPYSGFQM